MKRFVKQIALRYSGRIIALVVLLTLAAPCVLAQGVIKAWGYNGDGQLGDGTNIDRTIPDHFSFR